LPHSDARGNRDGESIMIDPVRRMNQIATASEHDKRREKATTKAVPGGILSMGLMLDTLGKLIAGYLQKEVPGYEPFTPSDPEYLRSIIEPGDVLLVEGNNRISGIIKYLTQSTWSHAALYVGPIDGAREDDGEPHVLIEANVGEGVTSAPLSKYFTYHTRVCRPVGLSYEDRNTVCRYAINRIGFGYDTKNILDLMRYLIPLPVPQRWRRRMIALGSGDPTKMICSALIAQAFDTVRYPILPKITRAGSRQARREILHIRDSSLYMPRDFDISPYFEIVKPTIVRGFDYTTLHWADRQKPLQEVAGEFGPFQEKVSSPTLVPEEIDQEAPLPAEEVTLDDEVTTLIERFIVEEHYLRVEFVAARLPERRSKQREKPMIA
jgi:permuted papain-like amidase YaeF/Yiix C92 family enzyme